MIVLDLKPLNEYTCQFCNQLFESKEDLIIIPDVQPLCSYKCHFKLKHKTLKQHPNQTLKEMWAVAYPKVDMPKKRTKLIFELTKFFIQVRE